MSEGVFTSVKNMLGMNKDRDMKQNKVVENTFLPPNLSAEKIDSEIKSILSNESGLERVKEVFKYDETLGKRPDYLMENFDILASVGVTGFILGSIMRTAETTESFKRNNQLAVYTDTKTATTIKGGTRTSVKFMTFSGLIIGSSLVVQAYRNKTTPLDYAIGGVISGGLFRMHHGLVNLVVGAVVGGLFGTVFGIARYTQLKLMGLTYEERRYKALRDKIILNEMLLSPDLEVAKK